MKTALRTKSFNYLAKDESDNVAYFTSDGLFIKWSDISEYEWAKQNWDTSEVQVNFIFPDKYENPNTIEAFICSFLNSAGVPTNFQDHKFVDAKEFPGSTFVLPQVEPNEQVNDVALQDNSMHENLYCYEHRNYVQTEDVYYRVIIINVNNTIYSILILTNYESGQYEDKINGFITIVKGNVYDIYNDIEKINSVFQAKKGEEFITSIC